MLGPPAGRVKVIEILGRFAAAWHAGWENRAPGGRRGKRPRPPGNGVGQRWTGGAIAKSFVATALHCAATASRWAVKGATYKAALSVWPGGGQGGQPSEPHRSSSTSSEGRARASCMSTPTDWASQAAPLGLQGRRGTGATSEQRRGGCERLRAWMDASAAAVAVTLPASAGLPSADISEH